MSLLNLRNMNKTSNMFKFSRFAPKTHKVDPKANCKTHKLFLDFGIIKNIGEGLYNFLPLGQRSLDKLIKLANYHMLNAGASKVTLSSLVQQDLWSNAGTLEANVAELLTVNGRDNTKRILAPTHEEAMTSFMASCEMSYKCFPVLLYQITSKFRNELRPKFGLIRTKEFVMKDLYSFHTSTEDAQEVYKQIVNVYYEIFKSIGIETIKASSTKDQRVVESHEFHYLLDIGDDTLFLCRSCNFAVNSGTTTDNLITCPNCSTPISKHNGVEVGHTFQFGTNYSEKLGAFYKDKHAFRKHMLMNSYGIGLSRLLQVSSELLSNENSLRWPLILAPYTVCIIPPKSGSKIWEVGMNLLETLYERCISIKYLKDDVIVDDRIEETIGKRFMEASALGFPFIIVIGKDIENSEPIFELHDITQKESHKLSLDSVVDFLREKTKSVDIFV